MLVGVAGQRQLGPLGGGGGGTVSRAFSAAALSFLAFFSAAACALASAFSRLASALSDICSRIRPPPPPAGQVPPPQGQVEGGDSRTRLPRCSGLWCRLSALATSGVLRPLGGGQQRPRARGAMAVARLLLLLLGVDRAGSAVLVGPPSAAWSAPPYCGPGSGQTSDAWYDEMRAFRAATRTASNITGACANASDLFGRNAWASSVFVWPLTMMMDRMLYDSATHSWTVDRFLTDLQLRYGGIDGVLLWQSYTNMGVDSRNQIDLLRCAPGGLPGLADLIDQFHSRNVSVIFPWNQWAGNYTNGPREESE